MYKFIGWSKEDNSKNIEYRIGDVFKCTENIYMYPVWEIIEVNEPSTEQPEPSGCNLFKANYVSAIHTALVILCSVIFISKKRH